MWHAPEPSLHNDYMSIGQFLKSFNGNDEKLSSGTKILKQRPPPPPPLPSVLTSEKKIKRRPYLYFYFFFFILFFFFFFFIFFFVFWCGFVFLWGGGGGGLCRISILVQIRISSTSSQNLTKDFLIPDSENLLYDLF